MTRAETEPVHQVDEEGFVELGELERDWFFLQEMRAQAEKLAVGIAKAEKMFQEKMREANATGLKIHGVKKVIYKKNATFPAAKFAAEHPGVAAAFMTKVDKFDTAAFREARPQEYQQWLGHTFKYVTPKAGG